MTTTATRSRRILAGVLAGAMALAVTPILGLTGTAGAADAPPPVADPIGTGNVCEGASGEEPFTDVSSADPSFDEIVCLVEAGLTTGTTATTYEPNATLTRRQMALFLKRLVDRANENEAEGADLEDLPAYDGNTAPFTDIDAESNAVKQAIGQLQQAGIAQGVTATEYRPADELTRRQMAQFVVRVLEFLTGEEITANGDYFDDDADESAAVQEALNQVAEEGIFLGDGQGNVAPGEDLTRRQMANILLRALESLFEDGDIERLFAEEAPPTNQTINVDPDETVAQEFPAAADRDYTATGLTAGQRYRVALVDAANVTVGTNGVVTFATTTPNSGDCANVRIADAGTLDARITAVNGATVTAAQSVGNIQPVNGSISFTVRGSSTEGVIPVVHVDNDATGCTFLEVGANGAPSEAFGIGGRTNFRPAESTGGGFNGTITDVDKTDDFFVVNGVRYDYDANDTFVVGSVPSNLTQFEVALSSGDTISGVYAPSDDVASTFTLTDSNPGTPTGVAATQDGATVRVSWTAAAGDVDSFNVYRALSGNGTDCDVATTPLASYTVVGRPTASPFVDSTVTVPEQYCYAVSQVNDGDEGARSTTPAFVSLTTASASAPTITQVKVIDDQSFAGQMDAGDVHRFIFSEPMSPTIASNGSSYRLNADAAIVTCGSAPGTTCSLNRSPVTIGGVTQPAGTVLTVTLGTTLPVPAVPYPATISSVTTHWDDQGGTQLDLAGSPDKTVEVDESTPTTPIAPRATAATDSADGPDTATITFSEPVSLLGSANLFKVVADGADCTAAAVASGNGATVTDDDDDNILVVAFGGDIAAGAYELCVGAGAVEDLDGTDNVAHTVPFTVN